MLRVIIHHSQNITHLTAKVIKYAGRKALHIFFPPVIHYLTDKYQDRYHHLIADTVFALAAIVLLVSNFGLGYWYYQYLTPAELELNVGQSAVVISGENIEYTVNYYNYRKPIDNFQIAFILPSGFTLDPGASSEFFLGHLEKNQSGMVKVKGRLIGEVGRAQSLKVVYGYSFQGNFFQEEQEHNYKIQDSNLVLTTELPTSVLQDKEFTFKVKYQNKSNLERSGVVIDLTLPANLVLLDYPEPKITLEKIEPQSSGEVELRAKFTEFGDVNNLIQLSASLGGYVQNQEQGSIEVLSPRLSCTSLVNGQKSAVADLGDNLIYRITCQNIGDAVLNNIAITSGQKELFISQLEPGAFQTVSYAYLSGSEIRQYNYALTTATSARAQIEDFDLYTYSPETMTEVKFNTALDFSNRAEYYGPAGEQIGYGPWPPQAEEITALRIFWQVEDITNNLSNITIKTTLPSQAAWTGQTSVTTGTNIIYNPETREVLWHIGSLKAFSRYPLAAGFEIRILPNWQQVGKKINLTNSTYFTALDAFTGNYLERLNIPLQTQYAVE